MTNEQHAEHTKEGLYAAYLAGQEVSAFRRKLSLAGLHLESLGRALQERPETVTRLPDPHSQYDYSEGIRILRDGEKIIKMCEDLRFAEHKAKARGRLISSVFPDSDV